MYSKYTLQKLGKTYYYLKKKAEEARKAKEAAQYLKDKKCIK